MDLDVHALHAALLIAAGGEPKAEAAAALGGCPRDVQRCDPGSAAAAAALMQLHARGAVGDGEAAEGLCAYLDMDPGALQPEPTQLKGACMASADCCCVGGGSVAGWKDWGTPTEEPPPFPRGVQPGSCWAASCRRGRRRCAGLAAPWPRGGSASRNSGAAPWAPRAPGGSVPARGR